MYLTVGKKPVIYHINDLDKLEERLGIKSKNKQNESIKMNITVTNHDKILIRKIYKEDYENLDLIKNHMYKSG